MGKVWLITSGKGGVGKSTLTACLGIALEHKGRRVCIIDADIGLRDQDAILGLENRIVYDIVDVASKRCRLAQALITPEKHENLSLLPAAQFARVKELAAVKMQLPVLISGDRQSSAAALVMRGDIIVSTSNDAPEALKQALRDGYMRVVLMYQDAECRRERGEAMLKAAACFDKLGQAARAENLRAQAKAI